jgi:precorrin-2 methylase
MIYVIGLGPGDAKNMTQRALEAGKVAREAAQQGIHGARESQKRAGKAGV